MTKTPEANLTYRVLYVAPGRREILNVKPDKPGSFLVGEGRHEFDQDTILPGLHKKAKFDMVAVQGRVKCLNLWDSQEILTPEEYDAAVRNNFVSQVFEMSSGKKQGRIDWITFGVGAVLILAVVGVGFMMNGNLEDLQKDVNALRADEEGTVAGLPPGRYTQNPNDGVVVVPGETGEGT